MTMVDDCAEPPASGSQTTALHPVVLFAAGTVIFLLQVIGVAVLTLGPGISRLCAP
jgi:hypothetical protein